MKDLTHEQEMKLSELLFKILWPERCWHDTGNEPWSRGALLFCGHCEKTITIHNRDTANPNLFSRSAFLDVFDAVKDRHRKHEWIAFMMRAFGVHNIRMLSLNRDIIASPHFQLEVLKWLLEKDGRLGEFEEVVK